LGKAVFRKRVHGASPEPEGGAAQLARLVDTELPGADDETRNIVTAIAGLLATVAYADRDFSAAEEARVKEQLGRIQGLSELGAAAICATLRSHAVELSSTQAPRYTRTLRQLGDRELRVQVLDILVDLAAADGTLCVKEVNQLRLITQALGLNQNDYNALQSRHRDKLSSLR
jgi:uncharacterized tellurite resistance protein B-like protein